VHIDVLADGLGFTEGPVWLPDGRIALTSISHGCVYFVDQSGGLERIHTGGGPNGLAVDGHGRLYVAQNGGIFGASGPAEPGIQVIDDGAVTYLVAGLDAPNDLLFGPDGRLWVTDTRGEIDYTAPDDGLPGRLWAIDVGKGDVELMSERGPVFLNGLGFSNNGRTVIVTATMSSSLLAFDVAPSGSACWSQPRLLHTFDNGWPDGLAISARDEAWVALTASDRIDVIDASGRRTGSIALPASSLPTNVCIGGDSRDELFVTAAHGQSLLRIRLDEQDPLLG
jgi:gluconolactonase